MSDLAEKTVQLVVTFDPWLDMVTHAEIPDLFHVNVAGAVIGSIREGCSCGRNHGGYPRVTALDHKGNDVGWHDGSDARERAVNELIRTINRKASA